MYLLLSIIGAMFACAGQNKVYPTIECISTTSDGRCRTFWGYQNLERIPVAIPVYKSQMRFTVENQNYYDLAPDMGQGTIFYPGYHPAVFSTVSECGVTWHLAAGKATALPLSNCEDESRFLLDCDQNGVSDWCQIKYMASAAECLEHNFDIRCKINPQMSTEELCMILEKRADVDCNSDGMLDVCQDGVECIAPLPPVDDGGNAPPDAGSCCRAAVCSDNVAPIECVDGAFSFAPCAERDDCEKTGSCCLFNPLARVEQMTERECAHMTGLFSEGTGMECALVIGSCYTKEYCYDAATASACNVHYEGMFNPFYTCLEIGWKKPPPATSEVVPLTSEDIPATSEDVPATSDEPLQSTTAGEASTIDPPESTMTPDTSSEEGLSTSAVPTSQQAKTVAPPKPTRTRAHRTTDTPRAPQITTGTTTATVASGSTQSSTSEIIPPIIAGVFIGVLAIVVCIVWFIGDGYKRHHRRKHHHTH